MGGINPYVNEEPPLPATRKFTITFLPMQVTVEVDPDKIPYGHTGLPGSILDIALANGIEIDHACGGVCACSTCHCVVRQGLETIPEMTDTEEEELSFPPGLTPKDRKGPRLSSRHVPD